MAKFQEARKGTILKIDDEYYEVINFEHIKIAGRGAFVRLKIKNLRLGRVIEKTEDPEETVEIVEIVEKPMEYIYSEGNLYYFMDTQTYEQVSLTEDVVGDARYFLKENTEVKFLLIEDKVIGIRGPTFCDLKVIETEPPMKGARISGTKSAVLEGGIRINVPLFINVGDIVRIDTRDFSYVERVK